MQLFVQTVPRHASWLLVGPPGATSLMPQQDITVTFTGVNPQKSMSFSSLNGTIDVTFPSDVRATVRMKTEQGEIYSDFDIKMSNSTANMEQNERGKRGKYRVTLEKMMTGTINGGGAEVQFKNFNGDIYIRKGK